MKMWGEGAKKRHFSEKQAVHNAERFHRGHPGAVERVEKIFHSVENLWEGAHSFSQRAHRDLTGYCESCRLRIRSKTVFFRRMLPDMLSSIFRSE